jgi:DNA-binding GntR family transcriptional regulator
VKEVRAIVDAIERGDAEVAAAASVRHVNQAAQIILTQPRSQTDSATT